MSDRSNDREEVDVTRRRAGDGGARERADAPSRRRDQPSDTGDSGRGSGGGGFGGSSGGGLGGSGGSQIPIGDIIGIFLRLPRPVQIVAVLLVCCVGTLYFVLGGGGTNLGTTDQGPLPTLEAQVPTQPVQAPLPVQNPTAVRPPATAASTSSVSAKGSTWLVMLYQDAKDQVLDQDIFTDLNEAERAGSTDRVRIVAQIDRYRGPQTATQWRSAKRFLVAQDADLHTVRSQQLADLGQVNMADAATLIDFVTWAIKAYPSDKYALIMSDHGMGWPGGWSDPAIKTGATTNRQVPLAASIGNLMYLNDIDSALSTIRSQAGVDKFELIGMDACLMSQMEVIDSLAPHARYAVLSEETEPALGWAYTGILEALTAQPDMSGADLSRIIVKTYITNDQRIVDDQARAEFVSRGSSLGGLFSSSAVPSAAQVASELGADVTLSAIDLQAFPPLMQSVNNLSVALQQADPKAISQSRSYAQSFTSIFGKSVPASYIDVGNWVQLLARSNTNSSVATASQQVLDALKTAVIAEKHGPGKPGATGVSIYFPNSQLYGNAAAGPQSYTAIASRFAADSLWDDFLAFFYTGKKFTQSSGSVAVPSRGTTITAPNAGGITVSAITLSAKTAAPGKPVTLSADVDGKNVGYVKLFVGFYDKASNSLNITDEDYLQSSQTREVGGVFYPVWPENRFTIKFTWDPIVFAINDRKRSVTALFSPQTYGAAAADAVYTVDGIYTPVDGSGARGGRLIFRDKLLRQVFAFTSADPSGAPREIITKPGDTFTVLEKWIDLDARGNPTTTTTQQGGTLTFGDQPLRWRDLDAAAGDYVVGFNVEDLDGNPTQSFFRITVQ
ncbi:MAG TPA: clostripain-related cysteine peptidase [Anaerolineae bacterium]